MTAPCSLHPTCQPRARAWRGRLVAAWTALLRRALMAAAFVAAPAAGAWGLEGHRITGHVAEALLDAKTRIRVQQLLQGETLAQAATWMDEEREALAQSLPGSARWHFNNQPVCRSAQAKSPCPQGDCASARIAQQARTLADKRAPREQRVRALRLLVHMVGDIHQPLHVASNLDAGGNLVQVMSRARQRNLHAAWDSDFVRDLTRGTREERMADALLRRHQAQVAAWQAAPWTAALAESHRLAREQVYGPLPGFACARGQGIALAAPIEITPEYRQQAVALVGERLVAAGARVAGVLQRTLEGAGP